MDNLELLSNALDYIENNMKEPGLWQQIEIR